MKGLSPRALLRIFSAARYGRCAAALRLAIASIAATTIAACTGGIGGTTEIVTAASTPYTVGGSVSGLSGSGLTLQNNGEDSLKVTADGAFTFTTTLISGNLYNVSVSTQPGAPTQTCVSSNGVGTVGSSNVTNVTVICTVKTDPLDSIGGTVLGLTGSGLVLQNNGADNLAVSGNGSFTFPTKLASGKPFSVSVLSPPIGPYQNCTVTDGNGTTGASDVNNVAVSCTTTTAATHLIGGTVSGLSSGTQLALQDNGRDDLKVTVDGPFAFATPIPKGSAFSVSLLALGSSQSVACTLSNASGVVGSTDVTNVAVVCTPQTILKVTVFGLVGTGLVLQDNGNDNLAITGNGIATFPVALGAGAPYQVSVLTLPSNPRQACTVANASGTVGSGPTPIITCVSYTVGGTVTGLAGTGLVLQNNGGDDLPIAANGPFTFSTAEVTGETYAVVAVSQPSNLSQTCTVGHANGTIAAANIVNVDVNCVTNSYTVGGTVTGLPLQLTGASLVLQNGSDTVSIVANGAFAFPASVLSGGTYAMSVTTQPGVDTSAGQGLQTDTVCTLASGATGNVTNSNIASAVVTCVNQPLGFAYVTNGGDNTVTSYVIASDGTLVQFGAPVATGTTPSSSATNPGNATNLYVTNLASNSISGYTVDPNTGVLSPIAGGPLATGLASPAAVSTGFTTDGDVLYVANSAGNSVSAYTITGGGNSLTSVAGKPPSVPGSPYATGTRPVAGTFLPLPSPSTYYNYYTANAGSNNISGYEVDRALGPTFAGTLTEIPNDPITGPGSPYATGLSPSSIVSETLHGYVFAAGPTDGDIWEYLVVSTTSGALASQGPQANYPGVNSLAILDLNPAPLFIRHGSTGNLGIPSRGGGRLDPRDSDTGRGRHGTRPDRSNDQRHHGLCLRVEHRWRDGFRI